MSVERLKSRRQFLKVAAAGRKWVTPGLVLQARRADPDDNEPTVDMRVGFTVSRKVGGAVVRNRVRRRLRAVADRVMPYRALSAHEYVVIGRKAAAGRPFAMLVRDLEASLIGLGVGRDGER